MRSLLILSTLLCLGGQAWAGPSDVVLQTLALEAASEGQHGMELVAHVLLNRARLRHTTPEVEALRPRQMSCWNNRNMALNWLKVHYTPRTRQMALNAWEKATSATNSPILASLTHYCTLQTAPYWARGHKPVLVYGNHKFYAGIK